MASNLKLKGRVKRLLHWRSSKAPLGKCSDQFRRRFTSKDSRNPPCSCFPLHPLICHQFTGGCATARARRRQFGPNCKPLDDFFLFLRRSSSSCRPFERRFRKDLIIYNTFLTCCFFSPFLHATLTNPFIVLTFLITYSTSSTLTVVVTPSPQPTSPCTPVLIRFIGC